MFDKLYSYGISEKFITLLENIYSKVQLSIRLPNGITNPFTSNIGLKQDCYLSPILFNLFINDISDIFDINLCQPRKIYQLTLNKLLLIWWSCSSLINKLGLQQYCHKWKLTVNTKKNNDSCKERVSHGKFLHF